MKDFFVSYNRADRAWAEWIDRELRTAGFSVVSQFADFAVGSNFVVEMDRATRECERMIAVLSPSYLAASFTQPEWAAFFAQDPMGLQRKLVPVRVRECEVKGLLGPVVYADLVDLDEDAARAALLAGVGRPAAEKAPPVFPGAAPRGRFPGVLPRVWTVPQLRNPLFTGREALLEGLAAALGSGRPAAVTQAISGLGGVGKTQLAVEYVYRHASEYEVVAWVWAETAATLAADYTGLAAPLGLPEATLAEQAAVVEAVRRWFEQHGGWALVFDNATEPGAIRAYLPRGASGHVLLTSRRRDWTGTAGALEVTTFERAESIQYLRGRLATLDEQLAARLAADLGDLPLALAQAAAFMEESGLAPAEYLDLLRERRREVLRRGLPADYPEPVATTWEISFERLEETSPAAAALLQFCAFLAPDDIPLDLIAGGGEHFPEPLATTAADPLALRDAVVAARRFSLLTVEGDALSVHRLVQAMLRDRSEPEAKKLWAAAAVERMAAVFPFREFQLDTWPRSARLLPHAIAAAEHAETLGVAGKPTSTLLNQAALYLGTRAELGSALRLLRRALVIAEAIHGLDHPEVAKRALNIGEILRKQGDLPGALEYAGRALDIFEAAYGPMHRDVAVVANNIGQILKDQGDLSGALEYARRALAIDEAAYGPEHPEVATDANNIGLIFQSQGDLAGALEYARRAMDIDQAAYGPAHHKVAIRANNIGQILKDQGDLAGALEYTRRALEIDEAVYGTKRPEVAILVNNIGSILWRQRDFTGALEYTQRALDIDEAAYGPAHPKVAIRANNIGTILRDQGNPSEARRYIRRALTIFEATYGPDNPTTKLVARNLASLDQQDSKPG